MSSARTARLEAHHAVASSTIIMRKNPTALAGRRQDARRFASGADVDGLAAFGERDLDAVEVARDDRVGEDAAGLVAQFAAAVTKRHVVQREHLHLRLV